MPEDELREMLRAVIQEELKPVRQELQQTNERFDKTLQQTNERFDKTLQQTNERFDKTLQQMNKRFDEMQKDVTTIKREVRAVWDDILRLDKRLTVQEKKAAQ